jgi:hypothetical protein
MFGDLEVDLKWPGMSHMLVLGAYWSSLFWISIGNFTGMDCTKLHVQDSMHKRWKVVRILGHFVYIVIGLALL